MHNASGDIVIEPNKIYIRNNTGAPVVVTYVDARYVSFVKLHINTRERIGSPVRLSPAKFLVRYA